MNNKIVFCIFAFIIAGSCALTANEIAIKAGNWVSPNSNYSIQYCRSEDINEHKNLAAYVILKQQVILWVGVSEVDESAHSRDVVWSPESKFALILNRPNRSECGILLAQVDPKLDVVNYRNKIEEIVKKALADLNDTDYHYPGKIWYANWKWKNNNVAQGEVHVAKGAEHTIVVEIDASRLSKGLKVVSIY